MKTIKGLAAFLAAAIGVGLAAEGAELRVQIPGISGEQSVPGYPGAMAVDWVRFEPGIVGFHKAVDAASAAIQLAALQGTHFPTGSVLAYNGAPANPPALHVMLEDVLISSYSLEGANEEVTTNTVVPQSLYLSLPGIAGENGVPGYPQAMRLLSMKLTGSTLEVTRLTDSASQALFQAAVQGTHFGSASGLLYKEGNPAGQPQARIMLEDVLISSYQTGGSAAAPTETVVLSFAALPEPSLGVAGLAVSAMCAGSRRRRRA